VGYGLTTSFYSKAEAHAQQDRVRRTRVGPIGGKKHCKPSCRLAAFKAKASRPQLPLAIDNDLFRLHFE
jgi:hypothetical protein